MNLTFHLVPKKYFESLDPTVDYVPAAMGADGFIHCTDDPGEMARVANIYYLADPSPYLYLYIDKSRVRAPIRYEDPGRLYPHIYGPLNRDAILAIRDAQRDADNHFLPPDPVE